MKYLIVGLGNIGNEYDDTRHNIGFNIVDRLAREFSVEFEVKRYASVAKVRIKNVELILIKPSTYMNLSGDAVRYWMEAEKISIERVLVIVDDLALPFGTLRLKPKGSDAGHNGLKDIALKIKSNAYARLRFGLGNNFHQGKQVEFVLGRFTPEEQAEMSPLLDRCSEIVKSFALSGLQRTMNQYN